MLAAPPAPASEARTRPADSQSPERAAPTKGKRYANLPTLPGLASEAGAVSQPRKRPIPKAAIAGAAVVVVGAVLMFFVAGQQEKAAGSTSVEAPAAKPGLPKGMSAGQAGMVWVGFTGSESLAFDSVGGKRRFTSVSPFEIARTETTVRQYVGCVANGGCPAPADSWSDDEYGRANNWRAPGREDHPINSIDWAGGNAFCQAVGGRLPTAAEWEWAARGAREPTAFPWGDEPLKCSRAIVPRDGDGCGTGTTGPVCSRAEGHTPEGLCDMTGNVREWTASWSLDGKFGTGPIPAGAKRIGKGPHLASPGSDLLAHGWRRGREVDSKAALYTQGFRCAR
jgi:formylglycine-generating enzyme required for sulfatase activity